MRRLVSLGALLAFALPVFAQDVNDETEKAVKDAAAKVSPFIAKIETSGGKVVAGGGGGGPGPGGGGGGVRKGVGPTSGVVVDKDGYIISSAFNFANKPTDIFVTIPGKERKVAKVIANDYSRMLTLLKVDYTDLKVPEAFTKKDIQVGQWSMALGRGGFQEDTAKSASVSTGIISATGRIWGKALQTDAKVSPVNYGGPLVAIDGKILGILVPASPQGEGETVGVEWYDSGIGFAIPFEDVLASYPRMKGGKDLRRGLLGFTAQNPADQYNAELVVGAIAAGSAAEKAGLKTGDKLIEADGKPVANFSQLQHILGPKYEGDTVSLKVERDGKTETFEKIELGGVAATFAQPFLGILPMRDDPEAGVEIRYVYAKSPADTAGLKEGDRIMKVGRNAPPPKGPMPVPPGGGMVAITGGRTQLAQVISQIPVGAEVKIEVKRKDGGKTETVTAKLVTPPEDLPEKLTYPSSKERFGQKPGALPGDQPKEDPKPDDVEVGLQEKENKVHAREYWIYTPDNYSKFKTYGVIIWLHDKNKDSKDPKKVLKMWESYCDQANYILIGPKSKNETGWNATEAESLVATINDSLKGLNVDRNRIFVHGTGIGGQMGLYLGFHARDLIRGVAVSGAALPNQPKDNVPNQPLTFFLVAGDKDPLLDAIKDTRDKLKEKKFPTIYRELKESGKQYIDQKTMDELVVWIDSLDKI